MNEKNPKPIITEEAAVDAAKAAYEKHKKMLYISFEDCLDGDFPPELEPPVMRAAGSVSIATIGTAGMIRKAGSKCASLPSPTRKMNGV